MKTQLEKLMFSIDLMDRVSGPAGKIQKTLGGVADAAQDSFAKITGGTAGMAAAGVALYSMAAPAQEFNMAIGEVRSLDVAQDSLDMLSNKAIEFSIKYGESARDFVSSSYDIQSAIAGLAGNELASFTNASGILAKGTKSNAATITNYMGTMYGIFKNTADDMGKAQWVEQLTGQTATAVQMFKTTGTEMAGSFSSLGADATSAGIAQAEQIAVLGKLQATMSGSEAGTKYRAFLGGIGAAQDKLGLKFTDSNGQMLGMVDILSKLQGKFGDTFDVAESDALKKAFGSDEAVGMIKLLMADTDGLADSIGKLGNVTGMEKAMSMADTMVDPFQRWSQGVQAVRIGLGQALLPVLLPAVESMAEGAGAIYNWTQEYPNLTRWIGYAVVGISGLTGVVAAFAVMGGMARLSTLGYGNATKFATLMTNIFSKESIIAKWAMTGWSVAMKIASGGMAVLKWALGGARTSFLWLNAAMYANPVGFVIAGVVALTAGVAAAIYYWDDLKAAFMDSSWGQAIMGWIDKILSGFKSLTGGWDWIKDKMSWIPGMGDDSTKDISTAMSLNAKETSGLLDTTGALKTSTLGLNAGEIAGMHATGGQTVRAAIPRTSPSLETPRRSTVLPGGAGKTIANAVTNNNRSDSSTVQIGQIVTSRPLNAQEIGGQMAMAGA